MEVDELRIYRGEDIEISDHIRIHQPTLGEICDYGEQKYFSMIYQFTSNPQGMKFQLDDVGIDYTTITSYELFCNVIYRLFSIEETSILFGDLDFTKFRVSQRKDNGEIVLRQIVEGDSGYDEVLFDEYTYMLVMDYLCKSNNIKLDEEIPANETTKEILIEDAREEYERSKNKEYHSHLKNLVSAMVNSEGFKYNHAQVWDMKINAFMDSVQRINRIKNSDLILQSGYSGFGINLKEINKKDIDWLGEL